MQEYVTKDELLTMPIAFKIIGEHAPPKLHPINTAAVAVFTVSCGNLSDKPLKIQVSEMV